MLRYTSRGIFVLFTYIIVTIAPAEAFFYGQSRDGVSKTAFRKLNEGKTVTAPYGHVRFCVHNPEECVIRVASAGQGEEKSLEDLSYVNRVINSQIRPMEEKSLVDHWKINPSSGDCDDYAVTKRHVLLKRGWPSSALRLAVARYAGRQDHLVLIVRHEETDYILDNLSGQVRPVSAAGYSWEMIQSEENPRHWVRVNI